MATFREHCLFPVIEDLTITKHNSVGVTEADLLI